MPQTFYHGSIIPEIHTLEPRSLYHGGLPKEHHPQIRIEWIFTARDIVKVPICV